MPFTFAHPVAVIPFIKKGGKYFSATGLIAGSIIPDFEYFFRLTSLSTITHTITGIFAVDVPCALLLCVLFHWFIKQPLISSLPSSIQKYFGHLTTINWLAYFKENSTRVILSCMIGSVTHVLWDGVSNANGLLVERSGFLQQELLFNGWYIYRLTWWVSTIAGTIYMACYITHQTSSAIVLKKYTHYWATVFLFVVIILIADTVVFIRPHYYRDFFIAILGAYIFAIIFTSAICRIRKV